jgi:hypothetical protein
MRPALWTAFALLAVAPSAVAQTASVASAPDPAVDAVIHAVMPRAAAWGPVKGAPFSATETTTREQTLSDGTLLKSTVDVQLYRDSQGRMRAESALKSASGRVITLWNPLDGTAVTWITGSQAANFVSAAQLPETQLNAMMGASASAPATTPGARSRPDLTAPANIRTDSLPLDSIAGLDVTHSRTTQVISAGTVDNDRDFTVVSETWTSPELKTTVRQSNSDPRTGTVTIQLSNIDRSEPDAALFKPPAGSKTVEIPSQAPPH